MAKKVTKVVKITEIKGSSVSHNGSAWSADIDNFPDAKVGQEYELTVEYSRGYPTGKIVKVKRK